MREPEANEDEVVALVRRPIGCRAGEAFTLIQLAMYLGLQGEYGDALLAAQQSVALADEIGHRK